MDRKAPTPTQKSIDQLVKVDRPKSAAEQLRYVEKPRK